MLWTRDDRVACAPVPSVTMTDYLPFVVSGCTDGLRVKNPRYTLEQKYAYDSRLAPLDLCGLSLANKPF